MPNCGRLVHIIILLVVAILCSSDTAISQQKQLPLNRFRMWEVEKSVAHVDSSKHTALKPFLESRWELNDVFGYARDSAKYYHVISVKAMRDHLVRIEGEDYKFTLDPVFDFQVGYDASDKTGYQDTALIMNNTRGLIVQGDVGKMVSFQTMVFENQSRFPNYLKSFIDSTGVIPGQGRAKPFKNGGVDYNNSYGWLSVTPMKQLNVQIGHGKHFIGHGYRSVLLSDAAHNYPYLKGSGLLLKEKLQIDWIYASLQSLNRLPLGEVPESLFEKKALSVYHVNFNPHPRVQIGLFESVIWKRWDSTGTQAFNAQALIPVPFVNSAILGLEDENNVMVGVNVLLKPLSWLSTYGQMAYDGSDQMAWQAGLKMYNVGLKNLDFQVEYNYITSSTYAHQNPLQGFTHMNQPLSHPLGPNTEEIVGMVNFRHKRFFVNAKTHWQWHDDFAGGDAFNFGQSDMALDFITKTNIIDLQTGIFMNQKTNVNISLGWLHRDQSRSLVNSKTDWIYVAFRSSLFNKYYDF
jgi:hypothetical protein